MIKFSNDNFPILCETCLGPNPYIRMTQESYAKTCKICDRPMNVFRWKSGTGFRYKKTEICKTCAKLKNVCQTCILDLQYGLPVQVRDATLEESDKLKIPLSNVTRDYIYEQYDEQKTNQKSNILLRKIKNRNTLLEKMRRTGPYYERNRSQICSFF